MKDWMKAPIFLFIAVVAVLPSAGWSPAPPQGTLPPLDTIPLRAIRTIGENLPRLMDMQVIDGKLVVANLPPASPIEVWDIRSGRKLRGIGAWGAGPEEFQGVYFIDPAANADGAWIYDVTRHRLAYLGLTAEALASSNPIQRWLTVRTDAVLTSPTWVGDSIFTPGYFHTGRLAVFNGEGRFSRFLGTAPSKPNEPVVATQNAYHSHLAVRPDGDLFALATRWGGMLDIYRRDGRLAARAEFPHRFQPEYTIAYQQGEPKPLRAENARHGFLGLESDSDAIYALFSGQPRVPGAFYGLGRMIHVFDWSGRRVADFELEKRAAMIAVDGATRRLYALHTTPHLHIGVYVLPGAGR